MYKRKYVITNWPSLESTRMHKWILFNEKGRYKVINVTVLKQKQVIDEMRHVMYCINKKYIVCSIWYAVDIVIVM